MESEKYELREITPKKMRCGIGVCPAIYETNRDTYVLIGKQVDPRDADLEGKVGDDELLVEIPRALLEGVGGENVR